MLIHCIGFTMIYHRFRQVVTCLLREKKYYKGLREPLQGWGKYSIPLFNWLGVEVVISLTPARRPTVIHRGCQLLSSSLRFMLCCVWVPPLHLCEAGWPFLFIANIRQLLFQPLPHLCETGWSFLFIANIRQLSYLTITTAWQGEGTRLHIRQSFLCGHQPLPDKAREKGFT
jgi:hypothetical protein